MPSSCALKRQMGLFKPSSQKSKAAALDWDSSSSYSRAAESNGKLTGNFLSAPRERDKIVGAFHERLACEDTDLSLSKTLQI